MVGFSISCCTGNEDRTGHSGLDPLLYSIKFRLERRATTKNNENQSVCDRFSIVYLLYWNFLPRLGKLLNTRWNFELGDGEREILERWRRSRVAGIASFVLLTDIRRSAPPDVAS